MGLALTAVLGVGSLILLGLGAKFLRRDRRALGYGWVVGGLVLGVAALLPLFLSDAL